MVLKLAVGVITGSVAVLSDGIDSAEDAIAASIAFVSVRYGARPPDIEHPYGHGRAETVAAGLQALLIAAGGAFVVYRAIDRFIDPPESIGTNLGLLTMAIAAAANLIVVQYAGRVARITRSPAIASDARHLWTNIVQAAAVLLGLALVAITDEVRFDAAVALMLGAYLLWTAAAIMRSAAGDILDVSLTEDELRFVEEAILAEQDEIAGYHRLRTRRSGQSRHIDFHLILPPALTVAEAHVITDRIEARIRSRWPASRITIHAEPADGRFLGPLQEAASRGREGESTDPRPE
jgi:cation diffusion facilitator family transporter